MQQKEIRVPCCVPSSLVPLHSYLSCASFWRYSLCVEMVMFLPLPFYMDICSTLDPLFYALHFCLSLCFVHLSKMSHFSTVWTYCDLMGTSIVYDLLLLQKLLRWTNDLTDIFTMERSNKTSSLLNGMALSTNSSDFLPGHWWTLTRVWPPIFFNFLNTAPTTPLP